MTQPVQSLAIGQSVTIDTSGGTNSQGDPVESFDSAPNWSVSDETILSVVAASNGLSAKITALAAGNANVLIAATSDEASFNQSIPFNVPQPPGTISYTVGTPS